MSKERSSLRLLSSRKRWFFRIFIAVGSSVLFFTTIELSLRLAGIKPLEFRKTTNFQYHPTRIWSLIPQNSRQGCETYIKTNSAGYRGPEFQIEKPSKVKRFIFLGDSVMFGHGVLYQFTMCRQLEVLLAEKPLERGIRYQCYNMGTPGYGLYQSYLALKEDGLKYHPDFVILNVCFNDMGDDRFRFGYESVEDYAHRKWGLKSPNWKQQLHQMFQKLSIYRFIFQIKYTAIEDYPKDYLSLFGITNDVLTNEEEEAWKFSEQILQKYAQLTSQHNTLLILTCLPSKTQLLQEAPNLHAQGVLAHICKRLDLPLFDFSFDFIKRRDEDYMRDIWHLNIMGNKIWAELLYSRLVEFFHSEKELVPVQKRNVTANILK